MVQRGKVLDDRGQRWIGGELSSEDYFDQARRDARERARRVLARRLREGEPGHVGPAHS